MLPDFLLDEAVLIFGFDAHEGLDEEFAPELGTSIYF
jgi:hypothetical protein